MRATLAAWMAIVVLSAILPDGIPPRAASHITIAGSEVYIQQARGRVSPGASIQAKPTPETTSAQTAVSPAATSTAPVTCNAQNASSQACYTATQQARPAGR